MRIVIDIPEKVYTWIQREWKECDFDSVVNHALNGIKNGTPLPKGHVDLIDRSEVIKSLFDYHKGQKTIGQCIDDVQTIIEADKVESEEV